MPGSRNSVGVFVSMCPDCGSHLEDTWDDDASECGRCGFAYVTHASDRKHGEKRGDREMANFVASMGVLAAFVGGWAGSLLFPEVAGPLTQQALTGMLLAGVVSAASLVLAIAFTTAALGVASR